MAHVENNPLRLRQFRQRLIQFWAQSWHGLLISTIVCLASLTLYVTLYWSQTGPIPLLDFLKDIELKTLDVRFQLRGVRQPNPAIVIVAIDQKSQDVLGRWPFPRSNFADLVDVLREDHAKVIAFDINFPQLDQNSALQALQRLRKDYQATGGRKDAPFFRRLEQLEAGADHDAKFTQALSHFDNAILGYFFLYSQEETASQNKERVNAFLNYLSFQALTVTNPQYSKLFEGKTPVGLSPNLPRFSDYAKNFGFFNVFPDSDGTVRRATVISRYEGNYYPSLDLAAALAYTDRSLDKVAVVFNPNGLQDIDFGPVTIPTDPAGKVQIVFHGPAQTFPTYSLADVVQRKLHPSIFRDRLVLVGPTATGIPDFVVTPFQHADFPGVEVHANFIDNLLKGEFIHRGIWENLIDMVFILIFSLGAGLLISLVSPVRATAALLAFLGGFLYLVYYLFANYQIWILAFLPAATLTVNYAGIVSYRFFFEEREKRRVRGAFNQYVAPGMITQILQRPELLRLGGEERELTALFTDIRGFTTLSEGLSPVALVELLNEYLSEMTDVIFRWWGTLDKYIGDAIMAFWGAPYPQPDHSSRACHAALEMLQHLRQLQARWQAQGKPIINIGVGINTGPMLVGNMGSTRRFNYTVMGDNVNLASRLEGINKEFGTRLIVSETTYEAVEKELLGRELDLIRVKGKTKPVTIFELLGSRAEMEAQRDMVERFHRGLEAYRTAQWETALATFESLTADYPQDGPSRVFARRCRDLLAEPPEGEWDGVYVMKTK